MTVMKVCTLPLLEIKIRFRAIIIYRMCELWAGGFILYSSLRFWHLLWASLFCPFARSRSWSFYIWARSKTKWFGKVDWGTGYEVTLSHLNTRRRKNRYRNGLIKPWIITGIVRINFIIEFYKAIPRLKYLALERYWKSRINKKKQRFVAQSWTTRRRFDGFSLRLGIGDRTFVLTFMI